MSDDREFRVAWEATVRGESYVYAEDEDEAQEMIAHGEVELGDATDVLDSWHIAVKPASVKS